MATKTISLTEDAYVRLKRLKRPGESFSDAVQRLTGREDLLKYAGTVSEEFGRDIERTVRSERRRQARSTDRRRRDLWGG